MASDFSAFIGSFFAPLGGAETAAADGACFLQHRQASLASPGALELPGDTC
jgi:hypothetical protein